MSLPVKSFQEFYDRAIQTISDDSNGLLTDTNEGSMIDAIAGLVATIAIEVQTILVDRFNNCFFELANGPEVTEGPDDLQTLAVDHFGDAFARPGAVSAVDTVTFSRANNSAGQVTIPAGTIVKTLPDANGNAQRYATDSDVVMTNTSAGSDLSVSVSVTAVEPGADGSAAADTITLIESSLLDSTIAVTNAGNDTGSDAQDDSAYRETIRNLIEALSGATAEAIQAKSKTVTGVVTATVGETAMTVIQYDPGTDTTIGTFFRVVRPVLYIADSLGTASGALVKEVLDAIAGVRACGVLVEVKAATAQSMNWTAHIILNPLGPNFTELENNPQKIIDSMTDYINNLPIGTSFIRTTANTAILAIWGPSGTDDLTSFTTSVPSGDVAATAAQKLVAGTVGLN